MSNEKRNYGKTNKRKGSDAERHYAKEFRELGYTHCKTARLGSKLHDNAGIDLIFIPYNVQVKCGIQKGMNPEKELVYIKEQMEKLFPPDSKEHELPKMVIHKKPVGRGKKSNEFHEIVTMTWEDLKKILRKIDK